MSKVIGFDLHGADKGMEAVIEGLSLYLKEVDSKNEFRLFGKKEEAKILLKKYNLADKENITIVNTTEVIENTEVPALAIRRKKDSSMVVGANALKNEEVDCFVSSGSTGALVASGVFIVGRTKDVDRPAIGAFLPSAKKGKSTLILDLGANVETKTEHLVQYANLGSEFFAKFYNEANPKVGLVNIGAEDGKGSTLYKEAFNGLKEADINFVGNVEARDVLVTDADVLVVDGFSGNILLKSIEGTAGLVGKELKNMYLQNLKTKIAALLIKNNLKKTIGKFDYRDMGATPIFGVNGLLLKAHGSSDSRAFKGAFKAAEKMVETK